MSPAGSRLHAAALGHSNAEIKKDEASYADSGGRKNSDRYASVFLARPASPDLFCFFIQGVLNLRLPAAQAQGGVYPRPIPICIRRRGLGVGVAAEGTRR